MPTVNGSLTSLLQDSGACIGGPMEWRSFSSLWKKVFPLVQRDQAGAFSVARGDQAIAIEADRKIRRQADEESSQRTLRERDLNESSEKKQEEERDERLLTTLESSEEWRRVWREFSRTIDDLHASVQRAYARALEREQITANELGIVRQRALVLADGRRVYFTEDGRLLYGEDRREITDESVIEEARRQLASKPNATDYQTYTAKDDAFAKASADVHQLGVTLQRLDDLRDDLKSGEVTPQRLADAQRQAQDIIASLPIEARQEFERVEAARHGEEPIAYRAAESSFTDSPDVAGQFTRAAAPPSARDSEQRDPPASVPAPYRAAPQF